MSRATYRRQLKADERASEAGFDAARQDAVQVVGLMRVLRDKLRVCIARGSVVSMMYYLYQNMNHGERHVANVPIACGKGCSYCCNLWVDATAPEVFFAVSSIRPIDRPAAIAAVDRILEITAGRSFEDRAAMVTPCPLLHGSMCSIYNARPINCRTAVSTDAESCRRSYLKVSGDIPTPVVWLAFRQAYYTALEGALYHAGLKFYAGEWNEALKIALSDPTAEKRWLSGEDVFAGAARVSQKAAVEIMPGRMLYEKAFGAGN